MRRSGEAHGGPESCGDRGTPYVIEHRGQGARGCGDPTAGTHTAFSSTLGRGDGQP